MPASPLPPPGTSCSSLQCSQDFVAFPKLEQDDEKYRKPVSSSSSSHCSPLYEGQKGDIFEQKVIFSGFGSIMRFSTSAVSQPRGRDASPVDYKASNPISGPSATGSVASSSSHKRMPSLSMEEGEVLKEKKHKGSKKNKHGPGRPKGGKSKEMLGAQLAGSTSTSSSPFSGGSLVSSSISNSSRPFSHTGNLPSLSMESPLLSSGMIPPPRAPGVLLPALLPPAPRLPGASTCLCTLSAPHPSLPGAVKTHLQSSVSIVVFIPWVICVLVGTGLVSSLSCPSAGKPQQVKASFLKRCRQGYSQAKLEQPPSDPK